MTNAFHDKNYAFTKKDRLKRDSSCSTYEISSVEKFTTVEMKLSLMMAPRMVLQSAACSPRSRQMDSSANLTAGGGFPMERTSTRCCFLMDFTAARNGLHVSLRNFGIGYDTMRLGMVEHELSA